MDRVHEGDSSTATPAHDKNDEGTVLEGLSLLRAGQVCFLIRCTDEGDVLVERHDGPGYRGHRQNCVCPVHKGAAIALRDYIAAILTKKKETKRKLEFDD